MPGPAKYSFIFSKIKAKESNLLSCAKLESLLSIRSIPEFALQLAGTYYQEMFSSDMEPEERERIIWEKDITLHKELIRYLKGKEKKTVELLMERYDLDKLKSILRAWFKKDKTVLRSLIKKDICFHFDIDRLMRAANIEDFTLLLKDTPYMEALAESRGDFQQFNNLFYLEWALEKKYLERTASVIKTLSLPERTALMKIWSVEVDIANISFILRTKKYYQKEKETLHKHFLDYNGSIKKEDIQEVLLKEEPQLIEHLLGKLGIKPKESLAFNNEAAEDIEYLLFYILMQKAKAALGGYPFSIAIVAAFLVLKYLETKNIISIFYACLYNLDKTQMKRMVIC